MSESSFTSLGIHINRSNTCGYCELPGHNSSNCPGAKYDSYCACADIDCPTPEGEYTHG